MFKGRVRTESELIAYLVDCTLATVSDLAMKKSRGKYEYERQIGIAQFGIDKMIEMGVDPVDTRAKDIIGKMSVEEWASKYEV
jgi:hypothetical protein